jgi:transcriptional regulator with XRE-family HTH domain
MFVNLGRTLSLLRELRSKSQAQVAREAGIGKSQLSKYENGKELPKLDSLEKILGVLQVGQFEFFYTLYLVDRRAADLARVRVEESFQFGEVAGIASVADTADTAGTGYLEEPMLMPPLFKTQSLLEEPTDQAFTRIFADLLLLYRRVFEQIVVTIDRDKLKPN